MNIKKEYVAPVMTTMTVELERGFMSASIVDDSGIGTTVEAQSQDFETIDGSSTFNDAGKQTNIGGNITWE